MKKAATAIILDKRHALKDGTFPVKLRVTFQRKQKYYPVPCSITESYSLPPNYAFSEADFEKVQSPKPRGMYKDIQTDMHAFEVFAMDIIKKLDPFSFEAFQKQLYSAPVADDVFGAFERRITLLSQEARVKTASNYRSSMKSLMKYTQSNRLPFAAVTPDFLSAYERWMISKGKSPSTIGIYLRPLRAILNEAIAEGEMRQEQYPFGRRNYQIPTSRNVKKALTLSDIEKIYNYEPAHDSEARARDLWLFSYLCNGINVKDIALLRYANIDGERIVYFRAKTIRTSRQDLRPIVAMLTPELEEIIERWGNRPRTAQNYVFPILTNGLTPEQEEAKISDIVKTINKYMDRIAKALGIEKKVTTYTARHSFSTVLKRAGASIVEISEALGHKDLKTTEHYLDSFEDEVRRKHGSMLIAFKKKPEKKEAR